MRTQVAADAGPDPAAASRRSRARRLPIVGVMGSGRDPGDDRVEALARWIADRGCHLLTGGGGGTMAAVSRAFCARAPRLGLSLGVLPCRLGAPAESPDPAYPNPWVEIPIRTHLPARGEAGASRASRNHINILTADWVILLPGGAGTLSEARLALAYEKPTVAFLRRPEELPGLPPEIPIARRLREVADFFDAPGRA